MIELRNNRHKQHADSFLIYEKVAEVGAPDINGEDFVPVQSLANRKTHYHDKLDRIERRPDPKPKPPKPPKP